MISTSPTVGKLYLALLVFHKEVGNISKDASNPFFKSKYATLSNILDAIEKPLQKADIVFVQFPSGTDGLTTRIICEEEWMESEFSMKPVKDDPQGRGSCITYMRRYALSAILGLNIDEDDDGNKASGNKNDNIPEWDTQATEQNEKALSDKPKCQKCGADMAISKSTGRSFCSAKCWLK